MAARPAASHNPVMGKKSPAVDEYIANAAPFAKPILKKLRATFLRASPKIEETIKWGVPSYEYKGIIGGIAAFKSYVTFGLWKAAILRDPTGILKTGKRSHMGAGELVDVDALPDETALIELIREAVELNEKGVKLPTGTTTKPTLAIPKPLAAAFKKSPKAKAFFDSLAPSARREYLEWITEAKRDETRDKRIATAIEWISEGKKRNWKYAK